MRKRISAEKVWQLVEIPGEGDPSDVLVRGVDSKVIEIVL